MSDGRHSPGRLAQELMECTGAVPVLVTLLEAGGMADWATLRHRCAPMEVSNATRWLLAVQLIRRHGEAAGSCDFDDPRDCYELTAVGRSLTTSLVALTTVVSAWGELRAPLPAEG